jgi:hypothetical protein
MVQWTLYHPPHPFKRIFKVWKIDSFFHLKKLQGKKHKLVLLNKNYCSYNQSHDGKPKH